MKDNPSAPTKVSAIAPGAALTPQQARNTGVADQSQQQASSDTARSNAEKPRQSGDVTAESDHPQKQQQADAGKKPGQYESAEPSPSKRQADGTTTTSSSGS